MRSTQVKIIHLGFLSVVYGESLHEEGGETRAGAATKGVEDEEALQPRAIVRQLTDAVEHVVDDFLKNVKNDSVVKAIYRV